MIMLLIVDLFFMMYMFHRMTMVVAKLLWHLVNLRVLQILSTPLLVTLPRYMSMLLTLRLTSMHILTLVHIFLRPVYPLMTLTKSCLRLDICVLIKIILIWRAICIIIILCLRLLRLRIEVMRILVSIRVLHTSILLI